MKELYFDYHATTPCDPRVVEAMLPYFSQFYGNPSSNSHESGKVAADAVEVARESVAALLGAKASEIVWTSGATESNNVAILGVAMKGDDRKQSGGKRRRIVTTAIEHKSVLGPCESLREQGFDVVVVPVDGMGLVRLDEVQAAIDGNTLLVSVQAANNEVGSLQPIAEIATWSHQQGALVHCDAAQATGKIPFDVWNWGVDLLSLSAHKMYGPKGIGALFIRGGPNRMPIGALWKGGGQEQGLRPGTLNVPAIVGFGEACRLCQEEMAGEAKRIGELRDKLEAALLSHISGLQRNGALNQRLPGNSSLTFPGIEADVLMSNLPGMALSGGSACESGALEPSHVLLAMGLSRTAALSTVRVGLGRFTSKSEVESLAAAIVQAFDRIVDLQ